ncbi:hypothetical protein GCM10009663_15230 [Kitasatospora arboriphila]|uniref:Ankyrin repeat domain-containing protein n=1 Tax=Kitasatospora arboriphila TaxID=258052 RepID=A0ABP4DWZ0_9ACTN
MNEIEDDRPLPARDAPLRALWHGAVDGWATPGALERLPAARRLLDAGADRDDLTLLARAVAYEAVFTTLEELDRAPRGGAARGPADGRSERPRRPGPLAVATCWPPRGHREGRPRTGALGAPPGRRLGVEPRNADVENAPIGHPGTARPSAPLRDLSPRRASGGGRW